MKNEINSILEIEAILGIQIPKNTNSSFDSYFNTNKVGKVSNIYITTPKLSTLKEIMPILQTFQDLEELALSSPRLRSIELVRKLTNLKKLSISYSPIKKIDCLADLVELRELRLMAVSINNIESIIGLKKLTTLEISTNKAKISLEGISKMKSLKHLSIPEMSTPDISFLEKNIKLETLSLVDNDIQSIDSLSGLTNLKSLNFSANNVEDISKLKDLVNLSDLWMYNNKIKSIAVVKNLQAIQSLGIGKSQIKDFSPIRKLPKLKILQILENNISNLEFLSKSMELETLYADNNAIKDLSPLKDLKKLKTIELQCNKLETIPEWLLDLGADINILDMYGSRKGIKVYDNPIKNPPIEIISKGNEAIRTWFQAEKVSVSEVKILLVGHGEVGKTSLVKKLLGQSPNPSESPTHHIQINSHHIFHQQKKVKLNFWDFGGQEVMHSTHQFFLSSRSVYLLVLDGRRDEDPEYWLKHIESFGGNSPVLVILNKIDTNPSYDVDRRFLLKKYPFIYDFYKTSCFASEGNIDILYKGICNVISKVDIVSAEWPKTWFPIKEALENMTEEFISEQQYSSLCDSCGVIEKGSKELLAEYLNDLGVIVHFKDLRLTNLHILQPRWVARAAYKIINSSRVAEANGILDVTWLESIMQKSDPLDFEYHPSIFPYVLDLMNKFELCFPIDNGRKYLLPELMDIQQPKLPSQKGPILKFIFKYEDFLPKSIFARFIVRSHEDIFERLNWRTGVVLKGTIFDSIAILIVDNKDRTITISITGRRRREHFVIIRNIFHKLNGDFEKLKVTEWIPLPDNNNVLIEYDELLGYEEKNKGKIFIGKLQREYDVKDLLDGVESENIRRDNYKWDAFLCHSSKDKIVINKIGEELKNAGLKCWIDTEEIGPGDNIIEKITEGLLNSRNIIPCLSIQQLKSGWARSEYQSILSRTLSGSSKQKICPLIIDNMDDSDIPIFLNNYRHERYLDRERFFRFIHFLSRRDS